MYEDHKIKCSSCGKEFLSKVHATLCPTCLEKVENIK